MIDTLQAILYVLAIVTLIYATTTVESIAPPKAVRLLAAGFSLFALAGLISVVR